MRVPCTLQPTAWTPPPFSVQPCLLPRSSPVPLPVTCHKRFAPHSRLGCRARRLRGAPQGSLLLRSSCPTPRLPLCPVGAAQLGRKLLGSAVPQHVPEGVLSFPGEQQGNGLWRTSFSKQQLAGHHQSSPVVCGCERVWGMIHKACEQILCSAVLGVPSQAELTGSLQARAVFARHTSPRAHCSLAPSTVSEAEVCHH